MAEKHVLKVSHEIKSALLVLLTRKPFLEITVTDLTREAGIARVSFYRHYASTSEVLNELIEDYLKAYRQLIYPVLVSHDIVRWRSFLTIFLSTLAEHNEQFRSFSPENITLLFARLSDMIQRNGKAETSTDISASYRTTAQIGMLLHVTQKWLNNGMQEDQNALIEYLLERLPNI